MGRWVVGERRCVTRGSRVKKDCFLPPPRGAPPLHLSVDRRVVVDGATARLQRRPRDCNDLSCLFGWGGCGSYCVVRPVRRPGARGVRLDEPALRRAPDGPVGDALRHRCAPPRRRRRRIDEPTNRRIVTVRANAPHRRIVAVRANAPRWIARDISLHQTQHRSTAARAFPWSGMAGLRRATVGGPAGRARRSRPPLSSSAVGGWWRAPLVASPPPPPPPAAPRRSSLARGGRSVGRSARAAEHQRAALAGCVSAAPAVARRLSRRIL